MITRTWTRFSVLGLMTTLFLAGCGSNDPYTMLREPSLSPSLGLPASSSVISGTVGPFTSGTGGFDYTISPLTSNVLAPDSGIVSAVDTTLDSNCVAITIFHNSRLSTRIRRLSTATALQVGRSVTAGDAIGTPCSGVINVAVFVDNAAVCPLSQMTSDARVFLSARFAGIFPCQI